MTRDPVREALVSARTRAWLAYVDCPTPSMDNLGGWHEYARLESAYESAADAVAEYDRTTPAASSDAGDTTTEGNP